MPLVFHINNGDLGGGFPRHRLRGSEILFIKSGIVLVNWLEAVLIKIEGRLRRKDAKEERDRCLVHVRFSWVRVALGGCGDFLAQV